MLLILHCCCLTAIGGEPPIAAAYPGDKGIQQDPRVLWVEDFESPSVEALTQRWETVREREQMRLDKTVPRGSAGQQSLCMTHIGGQGTGGHLYRRLPAGHDQIHARFYVRFDRDCAPIHHFGTCLGGNQPSTPWPSVKAGQPTDGAKALWVGIEPFGEQWTWDYYAYWHQMRGSPPRGQTWGNSFIHDRSLKVEKDQWICVEMMIKLNRPDDHDGELALWIDGRQVSHLGPGFPKGKWVFDKFLPGEGGASVRWDASRGDRQNFETAAGGEPFEGFQWRTDDDLQLNFVWLYVYITGAAPGQVSRVWFDDVVVATAPIGPLHAP